MEEIQSLGIIRFILIVLIVLSRGQCRSDYIADYNTEPSKKHILRKCAQVIYINVCCYLIPIYICCRSFERDRGHVYQYVMPRTSRWLYQHKSRVTHIHGFISCLCLSPLTYYMASYVFKSTLKAICPSSLS